MVANRIYFVGSHSTGKTTMARFVHEKYNIDYIYFSPRTKQFFNIEKIPYIYEECFPLVYDKEIKIYEVKCTI